MASSSLRRTLQTLCSARRPPSPGSLQPFHSTCGTLFASASRELLEDSSVLTNARFGKSSAVLPGLPLWDCFYVGNSQRLRQPIIQRRSPADSGILCSLVLGVHARRLHLLRDQADHPAQSFVNSRQEQNLLEYEASKKVVRPLYRALLHAARELNDEFHRFGNKDLLSSSELAWLQDQAPGAVAAIRQGAGDELEDFLKQEFRESLPSSETTDYSQLKHELGGRLDCGFQALSMITRRVGLLRGHAADPASDCTTHGIRVTVNSWFSTAERRIGSFYHYRIKVRNEGNPEPVQLIGRHWFITDFNGRTQEVIGPGVIGQQPVLQPGEEYEYSSFTPLMSKRGTQQGTYSMIGLDSGELFDVNVAPFALIPP